MFELTKEERAKLIFSSGDKALVEGLKKLFLETFLKAEHGECWQLLKEAFKRFENLQEIEKDRKENENIV